jgi:phasin family protein
MASTLTEILDLQKGQINAYAALNQSLFAATEKLVNLQIAAVKAAFQDATANTQAMLGARDTQEFLAVAGNTSQPAMEKLVSFSREVYGITRGAQGEVAKLAETQIAEGNRRLAEIIDMAAKSAPTGAEPAVSMLKTALAAANTAYDTATKATRQASDWAESNFAAAATATINAAAAANDAAKAKLKVA